MRIDKLVRNHESNRPPAAWSAIINTDGTVRLSHSRHGEQMLPNREALDAFIEENNLDTPKRIGIIIVDIVNTQGAKPQEL